jgi:hypothetical protein
MNKVFLADDPVGAFHRVRLEDFDVSWVGPHPCAKGFCLGSEDGQLRFTDEQFAWLGEIKGVSASAEAVNGVGHSEGWTAVTTRADINFIPPRSSPTEPHRATVFSGGAFGVAVAPSGHFVVPLGRLGIMYVKPGSLPEATVPISSTEEAGLNAYRILPLPDENGSDLIFCAGRRGGLGITNIREGVANHTLSTLRLGDLDVVDVCLLGAVENRLAVAAAATDGTIIFFQDILHDRTPRTIKFRSVKGTVYRILSAQGDVFLLTSKGLFLLARLAERLTNGVPRGPFTTNVLPLGIEASDANLAGDRWLLAVGADEVFRFDLDQMPKAPANGQQSEDRDLVECKNPWKKSSIGQHLERFAAVG